MTDEALGGQLLSLAEAVKLIPQTSCKSISVNTMWRWCRRGIKSRCGEIICLEHVRLGGKIYTTAKWLTDFGKKLAEADAEYFRHSNQNVVLPQSLQQRAPKAQLSKERLAQIEQAEKELRDMGV